MRLSRVSPSLGLRMCSRLYGVAVPARQVKYRTNYILLLYIRFYYHDRDLRPELPAWPQKIADPFFKALA